jgi:predicted transcriptional regulator of viral defense system
MNTIRLLKQLDLYPVFTEKDLLKLTKTTKKYARTLLSRLQKKGYIFRIERGKYSLYDDPLVFASHLTTPSYLSLWTALRYHNLTQQQPQNIFVMVKSPKRKAHLQNTTLNFMVTKQFWGYKTKRYRDFDIFMAEPEKAIIDSLLAHLPLEYITEAIEMHQNPQKLAEYAQKTKNHSLIKRLGYLLEKHKQNACGLKPLDYNYIHLNYTKKKGKKDKKWRLIL